MQVRSQKSLGQCLKAAITVILAVIVGTLVFIAVWSNTSIAEKIYFFLIAVIFGLVMYIFKLKSYNTKLEDYILRLESYIRKIKDN